jgi:hypothetical protein
VLRSGLVPLGRAIRSVTWVVVVLIVVAVVLALADANGRNGIVEQIDRFTRDLVGPFGDSFTDQSDALFTAKTFKGFVFKNWGLAAVVYAIGGSVIARLLGSRQA